MRDEVVARVGHIEVACAIDRNALGIAEGRAGARAVGRPGKAGGRTANVVTTPAEVIMRIALFTASAT